MILEILVFMIILGTISAIVARGGTAGSVILVLVSLFVGTVLGGMLSIPIILSTIIYYEFNLTLLLIELVACIFTMTSIVFLMGLATMKSEN